MQKDNFFEYVFNVLDKDEKNNREDLVNMLLADCTIIYDYNLVNLVDDQRKMNEMQCNSLEFVKEQFKDNNVSVDELKEIINIIVHNNLLERLHCSTIQLLSITKNWDDESFKQLKPLVKPVIDFCDSDPKNCDEFFLDLIIKNQEYYKEFEKNEKKLIKRKERSK